MTVPITISKMMKTARQMSTRGGGAGVGEEVAERKGMSHTHVAVTSRLDAPLGLFAQHAAGKVGFRLQHF